MSVDVIFGFHNFFTNETALGPELATAAQNITAHVINTHTADEKIELARGDWGMIVICGGIWSPDPDRNQY